MGYVRVFMCHPIATFIVIQCQPTGFHNAEIWEGKGANLIYYGKEKLPKVAPFFLHAMQHWEYQQYTLCKSTRSQYLKRIDLVTGNLVTYP